MLKTHKIVSIINQKGGVGKTTTAINFASGLALAGYKTLLIDSDPQGHATKALGFMPGTFNLAYQDLLLDDNDNITLDDVVIQKTQVKNLSLLPANLNLDSAEIQLMMKVIDRATRLKDAIKDTGYDFIIIDCRPTLGILTVNALYACDFILVPCEIAPFSLEGFSDLWDTIRKVKKRNSFDINSSLRILYTMYDKRKKISLDYIESEIKQYKNFILSTKIRQNEALNQAHMAQEPIFFFDKKCAGTKDYQSLTKEFLKLCHLPNEKK
jgi:chromosome partitioning protein